MEIAVALISALCLFGLERIRRRAERRRDAAAAASDRGAAYENFITAVLQATGALQTLVALSPKLGALPLSAPARSAYLEAKRAQDLVGATHARVRRLAPAAVAATADDLLEVLLRASELTARRCRDSDEWENVWGAARHARIAFEHVARADATPVGR